MGPYIRNIHEVLPYLNQREDITIDDKGVYIVIKYTTITGKNTFDNSEGGQYRRECRGLIFDKFTGEILSRPFHKFFNVGERADTEIGKINMDREHIIQDKLDGSMVRPFLMRAPSGVRVPVFATKSGVTDIASDARKVFDNFDVDGSRLRWIMRQLDFKNTPIFEYIGPGNRIVIHYKESDVVLLALRNNYSGAYIRQSIPEYPGPHVREYGGIDHLGVPRTLAEYVTEMRDALDKEGDVLYFPQTGERYKMKTAWYVHLHHLKDSINNPRRIIDLYRSGGIDDLSSLLNTEQRDYILSICTKFTTQYTKKQQHLEHMVYSMFTFPGITINGEIDRAKLATKFAKRYDKRDARFLWPVLAGKEIKVLLDESLEKALMRNSKFKEFQEWIDIMV